MIAQKPNSLLTIYVALITVALIVTIFVLDKQTPKTVLFILLAMYIGLLVFYWRQTKVQAPTIKIATLSDYPLQDRRSSNLSNFEASAQKILYEVGLDKQAQVCEFSSYSPFSRNIQHPVSLAQLPTPKSQYSEEANIFGNFNTQVWREQFRLALEQFKANLEIQTNNNYQAILGKLNLKQENITEAEDIVKSFLIDRSTQYCTHNIKAVMEANKILVRNFGLSLTKVQSTNPKEIGMDELSRLLDYYFHNNALPSAYKSMTVSNSSLGPHFSLMDRHAAKLHADMNELKKYEQVLEPMAFFPLDRFNPCLLIYILRLEFNNVRIQINEQNTKGSIYKVNGILKTFAPQKKSINSYCLLVQVDNTMSLMNMLEYRTKNCLHICLLFTLLLIKNQTNLGHPLLRSLSRILK